MAYMDQARKAVIKAQLDRVIPAGWKWTLGVSDHSTIVLTVRSAPVDLLEGFRNDDGSRRHCAAVNPYHPHVGFEAPHQAQTLATVRGILAALNDGNERRDGGDGPDQNWWVEFAIGRWDKPFVCTGVPATQAAAQAEEETGDDRRADRPRG